MNGSDDALRADIRFLGELLGDALQRHEGPGLLELVERTRALAAGGEQTRGKLDALVAGLDPPTAIRLVRAFSAYFHLANIAEQVHRADELAVRSTTGRARLRDTVEDILSAGVPASELGDLLAVAEVRPVFTAHPTEAKRRSVLAAQLRVAELLERAGDPSATWPMSTAGRRGG